MVLRAALLAATMMVVPAALAQADGELKMVDEMQAATLKVPGATLYYEVRGKGPLLVIIPGGPEDAGVFAELAAGLAETHRVVAIDPRGNSRSMFDAAPAELDLAVLADDVAALIGELGGGPADVFGTSGGAQIGLELVRRHPQLVGTLVAHEPPSMMLMADPSAGIAGTEELYRIYQDEGVDAAMGFFFGGNGLEEDGPPDFGDMPPEAAETMARVSGNFDYWLAHGVKPLSYYKPDVAALKASGTEIVVAIGEASSGQPIEAMAAALADALGVAPVSFPGDHTSFDDPAFAAALGAALK